MTEVIVESREVEDCHRIGKSNNGSKKSFIIRFINGLFQKKFKQGLRIMEFPGILKKACENSRGSIKKEVQFLGVSKKNS